MKRTLLVTVLIGAFALTSFAGGLLTNTNQSAQFVRMLSRNASTQIDAVYFNPAGLIKLENGWVTEFKGNLQVSAGKNGKIEKI